MMRFLFLILFSAQVYSDDFNEAVTYLGVLGQMAEEVSQDASQNVALFSGVVQDCEKYVLGLRDCCTDSGFLEGLIHCPRALQALQKAKLEHRVVLLGHYKPHRLSNTHYSYCVFPNELAAVVQIQGRFEQLGIDFGTPRHPNCRGITPDELSLLEFERLDLSPFTEELIKKRRFP